MISNWAKWAIWGASVGLDMDAFAGACHTLSTAIEKVARQTGIDRKQLCSALSRNAAAHKKLRDAEMWKHALTDAHLGRWIYKRAGKKFDGNDERSVINFSDEIPGIVRRALIEIARTLGRSKGGKPKALDFFDAWRVRRLVAELRKKGRSKEKAYDEVRKQLGVSAHTIRRECEVNERNRNRKTKELTPSEPARSRRFEA